MRKKTKIFAMIALMFFSFTSAMCQSNSKDVTKFLGIPVDGTKTSMIQKLKAKGFTYDAKKDVLTGEFNGRNVNVSIVTNNNKVYRIMVVDAVVTDKGNIKINFNRLCQQFAKNEKYVPIDLVGDFELSDEDDISYEISIHNKRYDAAYYQVSKTDFDSSEVADYIQQEVLAEYTTEQLENADENLQEEIYSKILDLGLEYIKEKVSHRLVWFMIDEFYGKYRIVMYYDNVRNQSSGEDL